MEPNLALPGQSVPLARIHETSAKFQRYKILLRRRWWFLLLTASIGVCVQSLRITGKPQNYISLAKLVAGGHMVVGSNVANRASCTRTPAPVSALSRLDLPALV